jgi:hypothetical protein
MQQWEYIRLYHYLLDGRYQLNGEDCHDWRNLKVEVILSDLGRDGWELVSVVGNVSPGLSGPSTASYYFFLKRPIS